MSGSDILYRFRILVCYITFFFVLISLIQKIMVIRCNILYVKLLNRV